MRNPSSSVARARPEWCIAQRRRRKAEKEARAPQKPIKQRSAAINSGSAAAAAAAPRYVAVGGSASSSAFALADSLRLVSPLAHPASRDAESGGEGKEKKLNEPRIGGRAGPLSWEALPPPPRLPVPLARRESKIKTLISKSPRLEERVRREGRQERDKAGKSGRKGCRKNRSAGTRAAAPPLFFFPLARRLKDDFSAGGFGVATALHSTTGPPGQ